MHHVVLLQSPAVTPCILENRTLYGITLMPRRKLGFPHRQFVDLCRWPQADIKTSTERAFCKLKAAFFILALLRLIAKHGGGLHVTSNALIWAFCCLTAPFAYRKSLLTAVADYNQSTATADATMSFVASLQFLDLQALPAELQEETEEVKSFEAQCHASSCSQDLDNTQ